MIAVDEHLSCHGVLDLHTFGCVASGTRASAGTNAFVEEIFPPVVTKSLA